MVRTCTRWPFHEPAQVTTPAVPSETLAASVMTVRMLASLGGERGRGPVAAGARKPGEVKDESQDDRPGEQC